MERLFASERLRRAAHREGVAGIRGPFTYQAEHSREFATWSEEHVAFESSGLSCSLLWTVSVGISFTVCLAVRFPAITTGRGSVILRPTRTII